MSESQRARVQAQFGASAGAYVKSPGHAAGPDLERDRLRAQVDRPLLAE